MPDTVLGTEVIAVNEADKNACLVELTSWGGDGETDNNQNISKPCDRSDVLQRKTRQERETESVRNMHFYQAVAGGDVV